MRRVNRARAGWLAGLVLAWAPVVVPGEGAGLTALPERRAAPEVALDSLDGARVLLAELRGKVVLVSFWATWCPPCRREMPSVERLGRLLAGEDFVVLAVNVGEDEDTVFAFTGQLEPRPTFPILLDRDSRVLRAWPVKGLPTTFVVDRQGRIAYRAVGGRDFDDPGIVADLRKLLVERDQDDAGARLERALGPTMVIDPALGYLPPHREPVSRRPHPAWTPAPAWRHGASFAGMAACAPVLGRINESARTTAGFASGALEDSLGLTQRIRN